MIADELHEDWRQAAISVNAEVAKAVIGQGPLVNLITIALLARGHVLLEGDVGVGKTTILRAFSRVIDGDFERIEGTIDLMPNDLVYHTYVNSDGQPRIDPGPLLHHGESLTTFFFNEINRARPQVQSLMLRTMAERSVSAFNREYTFPHMTVFADRNKVEKEETFELASAAKDRFMFELNMSTPVDPTVRSSLMFDPLYHNVDALLETCKPGICRGNKLNEIGAAIQQQVKASSTIEKYALEIWQATERPLDYGINIEGVDMQRLILAGVSPRGMSALLRAARVVAWLAGRDHLMPEDLHAVLPSALGHRIFLTPVYELRRAEIAPELVHRIMQAIASP